MGESQYELGETIYENSLTDPTDIVGFRWRETRQ